MKVGGGVGGEVGWGGGGQGEGSRLNCQME